MSDITDEQVAAAWKVAYQHFSPPFMARIGDYIESPDSPTPGPERDAALAALRAADQECERRNNEVMRAILTAGLLAGPDVKEDDQ